MNKHLNIYTMIKTEIILPETLIGQSIELKNWLSSQDFLKDNDIILTNKSDEKTLGVIELIGIILASKAVVELVKCINTWIKANRINATFKLKVKEKEFEMSFENLKKEQTILKEIKELLENE